MYKNRNDYISLEMNSIIELQLLTYLHQNCLYNAVCQKKTFIQEQLLMIKILSLIANVQKISNDSKIGVLSIGKIDKKIKAKDLKPTKLEDQIIIDRINLELEHQFDRYFPENDVVFFDVNDKQFMEKELYYKKVIQISSRCHHSKLPSVDKFGKVEDDKKYELPKWKVLNSKSEIKPLLRTYRERFGIDYLVTFRTPKYKLNRETFYESSVRSNGITNYDNSEAYKLSISSFYLEIYVWDCKTGKLMFNKIERTYGRSNDYEYPKNNISFDELNPSQKSLVPIKAKKKIQYPRRDKLAFKEHNNFSVPQTNYKAKGLKNDAINNSIFPLATAINENCEKIVYLLKNSITEIN